MLIGPVLVISDVVLVAVMVCDDGLDGWNLEVGVEWFVGISELSRIRLYLPSFSLMGCSC